MVSAMMLAAPGSSVTGMKGRDEAAAAEGVTADDGVMASSEDGTYRGGKKKQHWIFKINASSDHHVSKRFQQKSHGVNNFCLISQWTV